MPSSSHTLPIWKVPYLRNRYFTGGEEVLTNLRKELQKERATALCQPQGISGLGGIGKTQIATEYAYRHHADYQAVLWAQADSASVLTSEFMAIAQLLDLPERDEQDQRVIVEAVLRWFRSSVGWLLILDNVDDLAAIEPLVPKVVRGHILFTTRARSLGNIAHRIEVQKMDLEVGALLVLRRAALLPLQTSLNIASSENQQRSREISQVLDGLPLALDQAGAYIKETSCTLGQYLEFYQTRHQELLRARAHSDEYPDSVATTWSLSFGKVSQANPAAAELLNFCAFLASEAIPEEIITEGAHHLGPVLAPVGKNPLKLDLVYKEVLRYSLFQRSADARTFTIHRLVQAVLRDNLALKAQQQWMQRAIPAVNVAFPDGKFASWPVCERLLPHALICATWIEQVSLTTRIAARLLHQSGNYLKDRARFSEAEPLLKRALAIYEQLGAAHPDTATSLNSLATLYDKQGRFSEAEPLFQRALAISKQKSGATHPDTAISLNNLALLYMHQGKYVEAEPLFQRVLAICEQKLGTTHPDTATSLNSLAELYRAQGKYAKAEPLLKRALSIREQELGTTHPNTATSLNNLAGLYDNQGKYEQAEPLYVRALSICEQQLGATHPDTARSLNNLASLYYNQGKYEHAEPLYVRVLTIDEQVYGPDHPEVATDLNNLAELYKEQRKYTKAEPLYERAISIREQLLDAQHPSTAQSLSNLAGLYKHQGKYERAEVLYRRALAIREQRLGPQHPDTAHSLNNLAGLYGVQKKYVEAEQLFRRALLICEQQYGAMHPKTAISLNNLAELYREQGKYSEAEPLYKRALFICARVLSREHPTAQIIRANYDILVQSVERIVEEDF
jgi:tetratricopeptide (TPR) repeat protein